LQRIKNSDDLAQLSRLEPTPAFLDQFAADGGLIIPIGPFRVMIDPRSDKVWFNYAAPVDPLVPPSEVAEALREVRRVFRQHKRTPAMEFNLPLWERLPPMVGEAGFTLTEREPLMLCTPPTFRPFTNPAVSVRFLQADDDETDLIAFDNIVSEILMDEPYRPTLETIRGTREEIERGHGSTHALATLEGKPVGTGFIVSTEGVAEITRVATIPPARRQGIAATLTSYMMQDRFDHGDTLVWLTAEDQVAQALYLKLGFSLVGERLYYEG
jgi:ribosomal protein S18 acetylase RimI-like enzyme